MNAVMDDTQRKTADVNARRPSQPAPKSKMPPAGPHAKPELTDKEKTPSSGVLPEPDDKQTEAPTG
jgi:hypothetical protein